MATAYHLVPVQRPSLGLKGRPLVNMEPTMKGRQLSE